MTEEQRKVFAEQWVLEFVIRHSFPIDWFSVDTNAEFRELSNRSLGILCVADVREALVRLAGAGAVMFRREGDNRHSLRHPLDEWELRFELSKGSSSYQYGLTVLGGRLWEARAHPLWDRYVSTTYGYAVAELGRNSAAIAAQSRELAEQYLKWQHVRHRCSVIPTTVRGEEIAPWRATPWKTLPRGYRLTFGFEPHGPSLEVPSLAPLAISDWFEHTARWFTPAISRE
jgi:hypothetical protein